MLKVGEKVRVTIGPYKGRRGTLVAQVLEGFDECWYVRIHRRGLYIIKGHDLMRLKRKRRRR